MQMNDGHMEAFNVEEATKQFMDCVKKNPDLVFRVGEEVKVKGGDFRIKSMGKKMIVLEGLPGTRIA
jgi:uncharacterized Zn finger protein